MAERTNYTPGTFSWVELATTDQPAAKSFYMELFGWDANDVPMDDGSAYSMMSIDGKDVAAISPQREAGVPPTWNSYVTVDNADDTVEQAKSLGGTVHVPAFDVFDVGRMAVIQDPQGAYFMTWQPKQHIGASLVNAHGALSWNELGTTDMDAAAQFYGGLFGWTMSPMEGTGTPYNVIMNAAGHGNGGIRPVMPPGTPPNWLVYFGSDDTAASFAKAQELGATPLAEPMDIGVGQIAVLQDPQGAVFALFGGDFQD
jgi:uncharacterized protein